MGHDHVDVDTAALGTRRVHLLEPETRADPMGIDQLVGRFSGGRTLVDVAEHRSPEWPHGGDVHRVDGHLDGGGGVGLSGDAGPFGESGNGRGQRGIEIGQPVGDVGGQPNVDPPRIAQIDIGMMVSGVSRAGDLADERGGGTEGRGTKTGLEPTQQHPPVGQIPPCRQRGRCDVRGHDGDATRG